MSANVRPAQHREAVMVWTAVLPTLTVLQVTLGGLLEPVPVFLRPPIMATFAVPIVVYVVLPRLRPLFTRPATSRSREPRLGEQHKEIVMSVIRIHRYLLATGDVEELLARRAAAITAVRAAHAGPAETRLSRLPDGIFIDTWRWASAEQMATALADAGTIPEVRAAMSLTADHTVADGDIVDER